MKFVDNEHEIFFIRQIQKIKEFNRVYSNHLAFVYTLGICEDTRRNFNKIFDVIDNKLKIACLEQPWQTSSSLKTTRLAFNLFNEFVYDSNEDINNNIASRMYAVDNIFCCSFAPYFWEAIKIRFPEYTNNSEVE